MTQNSCAVEMHNAILSNYLEGVAHLKAKDRKNEGFFCSTEVLFFTLEHRRQSL